MKSFRTSLLLGVVFLAGSVSPRAEAAAPAPATAPVPQLWDTVGPLPESKKMPDQAHWQLVPNDLLLLEKDPPKASSDPGYYGREYSFAGDAVVTTPGVAALFSRSKGALTLFARPSTLMVGGDTKPADWSKIAEVTPIFSGPSAPTIANFEILRNAGDEIVLQVSFASGGAKPSVAVFSFTRSGLVEIRPTANLAQFRISGPIEYGLTPAFIGDDLIFGLPDTRGTNSLAVPADSLFVGLCRGAGSELVMTWPSGGQRLSLRFGEANTSLDFDCAGQSLYLAALSAPGIWHNETLGPDFLEKDVRLKWQKPFPAKWKTQLFEEELKTSFAFRSSKGQVWRGVAGSYEYPVWFNGDEAWCHLGKKIQPKGEALIYCLEGQGTPATILTPADVLQQTLGRQAAAAILDLPGRKLRTHHRRGAEGVRRACTCGCTEAIQAFFEAREELNHKDDIGAALDDMIYFVHRHVERIDEYQQFAQKVLQKVQADRRLSPALKPFLDSVEEIARQIPQECEVQKENMKSFAYADELRGKTLALASKKDPNNLKAYMELLKAWREMGGAQDYVVAKCHVITRNLGVVAGYACASVPQAVPLAQQIRAMCRQTLRNPDGYEVWADY